MPDHDTDLNREGENAVLKRLALWLEKEARLKGADIEVEVTGILEKLRPKPKPPVDPAA